MTVLLTNQKQARDTKHVDGVMFHCSVCGKDKPVQTAGGTGYGYDDQERIICYECCADQDRTTMIQTGRITLYLTCEPASKMLHNGRPFTAATLSHGPGRKAAGELTNWPGTLRFKCGTRVGRHNIAGVRYDVWFTGPDGYEWHGVQYGDNTQICRCKRTKVKS